MLFACTGLKFTGLQLVLTARASNSQQYTNLRFQQLCAVWIGYVCPISIPLVSHTTDGHLKSRHMIGQITWARKAWTATQPYMAVVAHSLAVQGSFYILASPVGRLKQVKIQQKLQWRNQKSNMVLVSLINFTSIHSGISCKLGVSWGA